MQHVIQKVMNRVMNRSRLITIDAGIVHPRILWELYNIDSLLEYKDTTKSFVLQQLTANLIP